VAREVGARGEEADALICLGQALDALASRAAGLEHLRRAWSIAAELGDGELVSHAAVGLSDALRRDGRLEESVAIALEGAQASRRGGLDMREHVCELNAAEAAFRAWPLGPGRPDQPRGARPRPRRHPAGVRPPHLRHARPRAR